MSEQKKQATIILPGKDGKPLDIPFGGSLELLAWGDLGYYAWRQKRQEVKKKDNH